MDIRNAAHILARVHTRDDAKTGFCVMMGALPDVFGPSHSEYVEAWRVVREFSGLTTKPEQYPA